MSERESDRLIPSVVRCAGPLMVQHNLRRFGRGTYDGVDDELAFQQNIQRSRPPSGNEENFGTRIDHELSITAQVTTVGNEIARCRIRISPITAVTMKESHSY